MCTAISLNAKNHYFGRNLDLEFSYNEQVVIIPRGYPIILKKEKTLKHHFAFIGMATIQKNQPLFYDAVNEKGVGIAALNFENNAKYLPAKKDYFNITPFEFIPWVLSNSATLKEAVELISKTNLTDIPFNPQTPLTPLHFIISDNSGSVTVEPLSNGLKIYDNPVGVLTNNPTFDMQMMNLNNYHKLSPNNINTDFAKSLSLQTYSRGMGAMGLPGDFSSQSRFVKAVFLKHYSTFENSENSVVNQFFHILNGVAFPRGCVMLESDKSAITIYSSCCNTDKGIYYYTTYENSQISAIDMNKTNLELSCPIIFPLKTAPNIVMHN